MSRRSQPSFALEKIFALCALFLFLIGPVSGNTVVLTQQNHDEILAKNEIVFVNFFAEWCRFSQHLKPIFEEASNRFSANPEGKIAFAAVDCDRQPEIAQRYHVNKYPTLKLFRFGEPVKREYRGQRSVDALAEYVKKQVETTIRHFASSQELSQQIDNSKRNIIGYYKATEGEEYRNFLKVASALREDCDFWMATGDAIGEQEGNKVLYRAPKETEDFAYTGSLVDFKFVKDWITDKCVPLVREITFENAEELTEEGKPFLILFRAPGDSLSEKLFSDAVASELDGLKNAVNCLYADGKKFAHPLHHLGKSEKDLPLITIDSFRHMYLFSNFADLQVRGKLRQFVDDLTTGKLHREFHNGPDPTTPPALEGGSDGSVVQGDPKTTPPESIFKQLKPADSRYTLLGKDEL